MLSHYVRVHRGRRITLTSCLARKSERERKLEWRKKGDFSDSEKKECDDLAKTLSHYSNEEEIFVYDTRTEASKELQGKLKDIPDPTLWLAHLRHISASDRKRRYIVLSRMSCMLPVELLFDKRGHRQPLRRLRIVSIVSRAQQFHIRPTPSLYNR